MEEKVESIPNSEYKPRYGEDLPGFRAINYIPPNISVKHRGNGLGRKLFIHALSTDDHSAVYSRDSCEGQLTTLRELQMMSWMNVVTDKENWDVKVTMNRFPMGKGRQ